MRFLDWIRALFHKRIFVISFLFICILVLTGIIGVMICFKHTDGIVLKQDLSCEFREKVMIEDFVESVDGKILNSSLVDTSVVGEQKVEVRYRNRYGFVERKKFVVKVLDVTAPTVVVPSVYTVEKGKITNLEDHIFCADDYDDQVLCEIQGEYDLKTVGKYDLKFVSHDHSGNFTEKKFTLDVIEPKEKESSPSEPTYTYFEDVYQQYKNEQTMIGLDLSKWQEKVDFAELKKQGVEFVMIKIAGQKEIGGEITIDPKFSEYMEEAKKVGLKIGVYFYSYAKNVTESRRQARFVISELKKYDLQLPIAFDWENWSTYSSFHVSFHTLNNIAKAFLEEIEKNGYKGMIYSSKYYLENIWYRKEYDTTWLAYYTNHLDYDGTYLMWQLCSDGKIKGIDGYVDIDVLYLK